MSKYVSKDHAQLFTNQVIELLESGKQAPWSKPWSNENGICNAITKRPYNGINVFILMFAAQENGFTSDYWATFKQIKAAGGTVKKGSTGTGITFFKELEKEDENGDKKKIFVRSFFTVFNLDQTEGLEIETETPTFAELSTDARKVALENHLFAFAKAENIGYEMDGSEAYYSPVADRVKMPVQFKEVGGYCGTLAHEFVHSTGHGKRLNRFGEGSLSTKMHHAEYAQEELVAEMGAGLLCGMFGITSELENHVSYLASWLKALRNDKDFIFKAASQAQKAVDFIAAAVEKQQVKTA